MFVVGGDDRGVILVFVSIVVVLRVVVDGDRVAVCVGCVVLVVCVLLLKVVVLLFLLFCVIFVWC